MRPNRLGAPRVARLLRFEQVRFLVVGGCNTVLGFAIYAALVQLGLNFAVANFISLIVGIGLSFVTQGRLVFGNDDNRRIGAFILSWLVIYAVQTGCIALLVRFGSTPAVAGLLVLPGTAALSYLVNKLVVFRRAGGTR